MKPNVTVLAAVVMHADQDGGRCDTSWLEREPVRDVMWIRMEALKRRGMERESMWGLLLRRACCSLLGKRRRARYDHDDSLILGALISLYKFTSETVLFCSPIRSCITYSLNVRIRPVLLVQSFRRNSCTNVHHLTIWTFLKSSTQLFMR